MSSNAELATIKVIQAVYGAVQGSKEVTGLVQDLASGGKTTFKADNSTLGGDPAKGHNKHFAMNYQVGEDVYTFSCKEGEIVRLITKETRGQFTVVGAAYGAIDAKNSQGMGSRDVTSIVQQLLDEGQIEFKPDNQLFGEPLKGTTKNFGMTYFRTDSPSFRKAIASNEGQKVTVA